MHFAIKLNKLNFYKKNIINFNFVLFTKKYLILFLILIFGFITKSQNLKESNNTKTSEDKIVKTISLNDSIPTDTIAGDTIKNSIVSKDAIYQEIDYSCADSMMLSITDRQVFLYGSGNIVTEEISLTSEFIKIDTKINTLFAVGRKDSTGKIIGKPEFTEKNDKFKAENLTYNLKSKRGMVKGVITEYNEGFLHGEKTKMHSNNEIHISSGKYTTCDKEEPHFYIELTKAKVIPNEKVISGPMYFVIADIPLKFIGLPFGFIPNQTKNTSGILIPKYGEEERRGFFLREMGYFFAINDNLNSAITFDVYTQGGWGTNLRSSFKKRYKYDGKLDIKYNINKSGVEGTSDYEELKTFSVRGTYTQDSKANPNSNFSANLNFSSSENDSYNATNINQYTNTTKSSSISYRRNRPGSIFNSSASINATQNTSTKMVNLTLPTLSLNMKRLFPFKQKSGSGKTKWYEKIGIGFSSSLKNSVNIRDSLLFTEQALYEMKNGLKYNIPISTSFKILKFINVSPSFTYNGRVYLNSVEKKVMLMPNDTNGLSETVLTDTLQGIKHPFDFGFSVPFSTKLFGTFNFKKGKIKAFRHVLSPSVSFNYRPDFSEDFWGYYDDYNYNEENYLYSYFDNGTFGKPPSGRSGSIGFNVGNNFEMKVKSKNDTVQELKKIKIFDNIGISTSYNLAVDSLNWSNISLSGNTSLFKNFSLSLGASFDPYTKDSTGRKINTFEWNENKRIARLNNARMSINGSISSKDFENNDEKKIPATYYYENPDIIYVDFNIPWSINISYNFNLRNSFDSETQSYDTDITQTITLNGNFSLTKNWLITARADYDFTAKKLTHSRISIHRSLHCWEAGLTVVPFGTLKSYSFRINIKSSIFQGLEYKKAKYWKDNL